MRNYARSVRTRPVQILVYFNNMPTSSAFPNPELLESENSHIVPGNELAAAIKEYKLLPRKLGLNQDAQSSDKETKYTIHFTNKE